MCLYVDGAPPYVSGEDFRRPSYFLWPCARITSPQPTSVTDFDIAFNISLPGTSSCMLKLNRRSSSQRSTRCVWLRIYFHSWLIIDLILRILTSRACRVSFLLRNFSKKLPLFYFFLIVFGGDIHIWGLKMEEVEITMRQRHDKLISRKVHFIIRRISRLNNLSRSALFMLYGTTKLLYREICPHDRQRRLTVSTPHRCWFLPLLFHCNGEEDSQRFLVVIKPVYRCAQAGCSTLTRKTGSEVGQR